MKRNGVNAGPLALTRDYNRQSDQIPVHHFIEIYTHCMVAIEAVVSFEYADNSGR